MSEEQTMVASATSPFPVLKVGAIFLAVILILGVGYFFFSSSQKEKGGLQADKQRLEAEKKRLEEELKKKPVDGEWSSWSECQEVSPGVWKRIRTCLKDPINGGKVCAQLDGGDSERLCPAVDGFWDDINEAFCEVEKDSSAQAIMMNNGRYSYYRREVCIPPKYGGKPCPTPKLSSVDKLSADKSIASFLCVSRDGQYGDWGACTTDDTGKKFKTRTCTPPENGGLPCLGEYPDRILLDNSNPDSTVSDYVASASSVYNSGSSWQIFQPFQAFNKHIGLNLDETIWHSAVAYNASTGEYIGTNKTTVKVMVSTGAGKIQENLDIAGEWIQLQFPPQNTPIILVAFTMAPRPNLQWATKRMPRTFMVCGSNDGIEWTSLVSNRPYSKQDNGIINMDVITPSLNWTYSAPNTGEKNPSYLARNQRMFYIDPRPAVAYKYYRLIVMAVGNALSGGSDQNCVNLGEWRLIGTIEGTEEKVMCAPCYPKGTKLYECSKANLLYASASECMNSCGQWSNFSEPGVCSPEKAYIVPSDIEVCTPGTISRSYPSGSPAPVTRTFVPHGGML